MSLETLSIINFRNLENVRIELDADKVTDRIKIATNFLDQRKIIKKLVKKIKDLIRVGWVHIRLLQLLAKVLKKKY